MRLKKFLQAKFFSKIFAKYFVAFIMGISFAAACLYFENLLALSFNKQLITDHF